jgi:protein-S-isoprenylcysteine O-methyltransferase Ste14
VSHSEPIVFPPAIPLTGFLVGVMVQRLHPIGATWPRSLEVRALGALVFCLGVAGFAWMVVTFKRARTPIHNARTPTALVESGPFRFTRNPMYLFGSTGYAGLALLLVQPWSLALLPVVFALTHHGVVLREEQFLQRHFGDCYRAYQARVPRWL